MRSSHQNPASQPSRLVTLTDRGATVTAIRASPVAESAGQGAYRGAEVGLPQCLTARSGRSPRREGGPSLGELVAPLGAEMRVRSLTVTRRWAFLLGDGRSSPRGDEGQVAYRGAEVGLPRRRLPTEPPPTAARCRTFLNGEFRCLTLNYDELGAATRRPIDHAATGMRQRWGGSSARTCSTTTRRLRSHLAQQLRPPSVPVAFQATAAPDRPAD